MTTSRERLLGWLPGTEGDRKDREETTRMYSFIGGSTVAGQHDRRVNHRREKSFMKKLGRPREMLLLPDNKKNKAGRAASTQASPENSVQHSRAQSRSGSVDGGTTYRLKAQKIRSRYGDECLNGRVSLLHFCVFFLLAGTIVITVGLVQYKEDAELFKYRQTIVIIGCISMGVGLMFFVVKCACFCQPKRDYPSEEKRNLNGSPEFKNVEVGEVVDNISPNIKPSPELNHHEMVIIQHEKEAASVKKAKKMETSESDLKTSDTIVEAEVEICYSTK